MNRSELRRVSRAVLEVLAAPALTPGQNTVPGAAQLLDSAPTDPSQGEMMQWRGRIDALALRARHSDAELHARFSPAPGSARALFSALEQARVEALGAQALPGMRSNLAAAYAVTAIPLGREELDAARHRLGAALAPGARALPADWRAEVTAEAVTRIEAMAASIADQFRFAQHALALVSLAAATAVSQAQSELDRSAAASTAAAAASALAAASAQGPRNGSANTPAADPSADKSETEASAPLDVLRSMGREPGGRIEMSESDAPASYRAYTKQFDAVWEPQLRDRSRAQERLDAAAHRRFVGAKSDFTRWAQRLHRHLMATQMRAWQFDLDEGILDAGRLTRVITDPLQPLAFKQEAAVELSRAAVTLLIDCSGSMRGLPMATAAGCTDLLANVLEHSGVRLEILGYTTRQWRGGRSRELWLANGRPENPGRLTDLLHIVFKHGDASWRHARRSLAAMLDETLLKENVDGEALLWAYERLRLRPEARRILMVISDGAPLDDATLAANDQGYLHRHLRSAIKGIESRSSVELLAIGIGHNVAAYYPRSFTVSGPENLGEAIVKQLIPLLATRGRQRVRKERAGAA